MGVPVEDKSSRKIEIHTLLKDYFMVSKSLSEMDQSELHDYCSKAEVLLVRECGLDAGEELKF